MASREITEKKAVELFGDDRPITNTRDRLIVTALDLFYTHGFHAVGIDRIIADVGVTKTTFYNHFESKDDLIVAAIERRDEWETSIFGQRVQEVGGDDPRRMLIALFDVLDEWFNNPDYAGCLFLNACSEFPSPNDPIHQAAAGHYSKARSGIAEMAKGAGAHDSERLAEELILLLQGALTLRQVTGNNDAARTARDIAVGLIETACTGE